MPFRQRIALGGVSLLLAGAIWMPLLHLAGLRAHTSVLCGTFAAERSEQVLSSFFAVIYILFYMATVIVAPILVIAAGVFQALIKFGSLRQGPGSETAAQTTGTSQINASR
ncbi:MAG TPA: hypothetical protein PKY77_26625 [Phycisphaerae bacterium]|nr:hypothetical protein [Phycisphaerae bacterium]HRY68590.1 hypothetical protein [Phycisphaerae bacterium]HSA25639.1 hypothetical protein [Phycisphaerae bacterium]